MSAHTATILDALVLQERLNDIQHRRKLREDNRLVLAIGLIVNSLEKIDNGANLRRIGRQRTGHRQRLATSLFREGLAALAVGRLRLLRVRGVESNNIVQYRSC